MTIHPKTRQLVTFVAIAGLALAAVRQVLAGDPPTFNTVPAAWKADSIGWKGDVSPANKVDDLIDIDPQGTFDIIVNFKQDVTPTDLGFLGSKGAIQFVSKRISTVCMAAVGGVDVYEIANRPEVAFIEQQRILHVLNDIAAETTKVRGELYAPLTVEDQFPFITGLGVNIAIIDTGCDDPGGPGTTNCDLPPALFGYDAIADTFGNPNDSNGHGTHVAGTALGRGPRQGDLETECETEVAKGVAPEAGLIDVKVFEGSGGATEPILRALETLIDRKNAWNVGVINMSLGGGADDGKDALALLVDEATEEGIVVVCAAGNDGPNNGGLGSPGSADTSITVANSDDRGTPNRDDDEINVSSSRGPRASDDDGNCFDELKPEIAAPGTDIFSAKFDSADDGEDNTGTSMASPHIAGICALMRQANPQATPAEIRAALIETAENRGGGGSSCDSRWSREWGYGLVDAVGAVGEIITQFGPPPPVVCVSALTVAAPNGGETFVTETTRRITWAFQGNILDNIDIFLLRGDVFVGAIATGVPVNDRSFDWVVGGGLENNAPIPAADDYRVQIRPSLCDSPVATSSTFFRIIEHAEANAAPPGTTDPDNDQLPKFVEIAPGESVLLGAVDGNGTVQTATKGQAPYTYRWLPADFLDASNVARPKSTPPFSVTYTVEVRDATGFLDTDRIQVKVGNPLRVNAGPDRVFRIGSSVLLEGAATGGTPPYTYKWSPIPDPSLPAGLNGENVPQPMAKPTAPTFYTLTVTDGTGTVRTDTVAAVPGVTLTIINNPGNAGTVSRNIVANLYLPGDQITVEAVANAGYAFERWASPGPEFDNRPADANATFSQNPTTLTFRDTDVRIEAVFRQTIGVLPTPGGNSQPNGTGGTSGGMCGAGLFGTMLSIAFGLMLMRRRLIAR